jgi:hypothetical protein
MRTLRIRSPRPTVAGAQARAFVRTSPVRNRKRKKRTAELVAEAHEHYGGVFRRLAE